jgi:hypothetical protein
MLICIVLMCLLRSCAHERDWLQERGQPCVHGVSSESVRLQRGANLPRAWRKEDVTTRDDRSQRLAGRNDANTQEAHPLASSQARAMQ